MTAIKILLVEDHLVAQKIAVAVLKSLNCDIDVASDGKIALAKSYQKTYDLILLDIGLPDMDGHAVTLKIRQDKKGAKRTPIVALTAHADEQEKAKALQSGMDDFLAKPLTPQMAQQILDRYCHQKNAR